MLSLCSIAVLSLASAAPLVEQAAPPNTTDPVAVARWMAKTLTWGVLSTISTRNDGATVGDAFGNPNSFADVDGVPYLYAADMDASMERNL